MFPFILWNQIDLQKTIL